MENQQKRCELMLY